MDRSKYPKNWNTIALIIKTFADWRCVKCDRPCRRPGESIDDFVDRLVEKNSKFYKELSHSFKDDKGETHCETRYGRFVLTVAHLDQDTKNNSRENLMALCPTCHNRHDAPFRAKNAAKTRFKKKHKGQLKLF
jgi:5-methylcytosine-specific restriction endonuclease McrA